MKTEPRNDMGVGAEGEGRVQVKPEVGLDFWQSFEIGIDGHSVILWHQCDAFVIVFFRAHKL